MTKEKKRLKDYTWKDLKDKETRKEFKGKLIKAEIIVATVLAVILIIGSLNNNNNKTAKEDGETETSTEIAGVEEEAQEPLSPQEEIDSALNDYFGDRYLGGKGVFDSEPFFGQIEILGAENLTHNLLVKGLYQDVRDAIYIVKDSGYTFENFGISIRYPLADKYGNSSDEFVIKSDFSAETIKKLSDNKNDIKLDNVPAIADEWWEHPAVDEE